MQILRFAQNDRLSRQRSDPSPEGFGPQDEESRCCHSERSEEPRSEYLQRSARFLVACDSSE
jgi:hypothetical protein